MYGLYGGENPTTNILSEEELTQSVKPENLIETIADLWNTEHRVIYYGPMEKDEVANIVGEIHNIGETLNHVEKNEAFKLQQTEENVVYIDCRSVSLLNTTYTPYIWDANGKNIKMVEGAITEDTPPGRGDTIYIVYHNGDALVYIWKDDEYQEIDKNTLWFNIEVEDSEEGRPLPFPIHGNEKTIYIDHRHISLFDYEDTPYVWNNDEGIYEEIDSIGFYEKIDSIKFYLDTILVNQRTIEHIPWNTLPPPYEAQTLGIREDFLAQYISDNQLAWAVIFDSALSPEEIVLFK
jgi:hypothetical protein